jgi:hypothetical protein
MDIDPFGAPLCGKRPRKTCQIEKQAAVRLLTLKGLEA